jgi:oligopeptide transport system permease protein
MGKTKDFKRVEEFTVQDTWKGPSLTYWESVKIALLKNKVAVVTIIVLLIIISMSLIYPIIANRSYLQQSYQLKNLKPSMDHFFGTDELGREIFSGVWQGGRTSLILGIIIAFINLTIGMIYGGICSYYGGITDDILMRVIEILMNIPLLVVVVLMNLILGRSILTFVVAMSISGWCNIAVLIRGQLIQQKEQEYILAAKVLGASTSRIISNHLMRNIISIAIVTITLEIPNVILTESVLSFMGFGSSALSWGRLFYGAGFSLHFYPYQVFLPALIISTTIICFNILGDTLRDAFNPHEVILKSDRG